MMSKKSLDKKLATNFINKSRDGGKSDQQIYHELSELYFDKKAIALLIAGTATKNNKEKYKNHNNILLGLLGISLLLKILTVINLAMSTQQMWALLLVFIVPLFTLYFLYEISRYNAPVYRLCGILSIAGFMQSVAKSDGSGYLFVNLVFMLGIVILSFYLDNKLFPNFKPGQLKKDHNGEYILDPVANEKEV